MHSFDHYLEEMVPTFHRLWKEGALAGWGQATTGKQEYADEAARLSAEFSKLLANPEVYARLKGWQHDGSVTDPHQKRILDLLVLDYEGQQKPADLIDAIAQTESQAEQVFTNHRGSYQGRSVNDNEIKRILSTEKDNALRREAWEAGKQIGPESAPVILKLVELRNDAARHIGYPNYYTMAMKLQEIVEDDLFRVLNDLEVLSRPLFAREKEELDTFLAGHWGVAVEELRPWHYTDPFFQEAPQRPEANLDVLFEGLDPIALTKATYDRMGLEIQDILDRSDLHEREGKNPHAFCTFIDGEWDIRVLANVSNNERWMGTMMHEFGHGVYDKYCDHGMHLLLRGAAHTATTEAVAILMQYLTSDTKWLTEVAGLDAAMVQAKLKPIRAFNRLQKLIFLRWGLVMVNFERALYTNPDADLNTLWWDKVEQLQLVHRPDGRHAPDWASKIHLATAAVYYHNYLLGELIAAQLRHTIMNKLHAPSLFSREAGTFLAEKFFKPGKSLPWNELMVHATGELLNPKYWVESLNE